MFRCSMELSSLRCRGIPGSFYNSSIFLSTALAVRGGHMPISALESSAQMFLGGATAQGIGLCSSLFLNRPTLLPMPTGTSTGLVSTAHARSPSSASRMSPDSCSASLCSSPASYCSFSEASPPPLGGAMAE